MHEVNYIQFVVAFIFVISLILLGGTLIRHWRERGGFIKGMEGINRLRVVSAAHVDARRRIVLVQCDSREHLLLIGGANDVVIDTNIVPPRVNRST